MMKLRFCVCSSALTFLLLIASPDYARSVESNHVAKQAERVVLLHELVNRDVFQKIEARAGNPKVWVTPLFYSLDFDLKRNFLSVVYAYYCDDDTSEVGLFDSRTNKKVGHFNVFGLKLD